MIYKKIAEYCIKETLKAGADKVQVLINFEKNNGYVFKYNNINSFNNNNDINLSIIAIKDNKKGQMSISSIDKKEITTLCQKVVDIAKSSPQDISNNIAEKHISKDFKYVYVYDINQMYDRLKELIEYSNKFYKNNHLNIEFYHTKRFQCLLNTNHLQFSSERSFYKLMYMINSSKDKKTSSWNGSIIFNKDLELPLKSWGPLDLTLKQISDQLCVKTIKNEFIGDVILSPESTMSFLKFIEKNFNANSLISGISLFKNKLDEKIVSEKFTIHSYPLSENIINGYDFTSDGYEAKNITYIKNGILKNFITNQYSSTKTGLQNNFNDGNCYLIETGNTFYKNMIKSIKRGILLGRYSGKQPNENGDFSGIAKNSYYIEDGNILYPISDTCISGNVIDLFNNIIAISKEKTNSGSYSVPYIHTKNIKIWSREQN